MHGTLQFPAKDFSCYLRCLSKKLKIKPLSAGRRRGKPRAKQDKKTMSMPI